MPIGAKPRILIRGAHRTTLRALRSKLQQAKAWDARLVTNNPNVDVSAFQLSTGDNTANGLAITTLINAINVMLAAKTGVVQRGVPV